MRSATRGVCGQCARLRALPCCRINLLAFRRGARTLLQQIRKKLPRVHAMGRVVRASVNTTRLREIRAKVAGRRFLLHHCFFLPGHSRHVGENIERVHVDVAVRAILRAQPAADAPILDNHFQRIAPPNGTDRTPHHAQRVQTLATGGRAQVVIEAQSLAHQARATIVRVGASFHASVAARAGIQIEQQQTLRFHQALLQEALQRRAVDHHQCFVIHLHAFLAHLCELLADAGELPRHAGEIFRADAHHLHMVQGRAGGAAHRILQQRRFAEIFAARKIGQHHLATGVRLRNFYEADAHQVKAVRRFTLAANHLAGGEAQQLDAFSQARDEFIRQFREYRNRAQMGVQGALPVRLIQPRAESFIALHDVQHVAEHFQRRAIRFRADRRRARIQAHASHFAEQVARAQHGHRIVVIQVHRRINVNPVLRSFFFARVVLALRQLAGKFSQKCAHRALRLYVRDGAGNRNLGLALQHVKRRGAVFAFPANHFAGFEMPAYDGVAVQAQKCSGNALEERQLLQLFERHQFGIRRPGNGGLGHNFVRQCARGAGNHALAAGNAGRFAHGLVVVERDARSGAFAHASQDEILANIAAAANAAVAQNACIEVHSDAHRGIVGTATRRARRITRCADLLLLGQSLQLAIAGLPLARARAGMIGHQQFNQRVARALYSVGGGVHRHSWFHGTNARRRIHTRAHVHHAHAADAYGLFVLLMAQRGNCDVVHPRGVENRGSGGDGDFPSVYRELYKRAGAHARTCFAAAKLCVVLSPALAPLLSPHGQTRAGQLRCKMCASTSARKCFKTEAIGAGTTCPRPQIEVSRSAPESSSINARSAADPFPCVQPVSISTNFCEPTRQGTHLPQDSLRKNCVEFSAMSSMQRSSAQTTSAPEPSIEPASASDLKSSRTSAMDAGKYPEDGPEGANPFSFFPPAIPPPYLKISSDTGVPIGTSYTPGCTTSPLTPINFSPAVPFRPCDLYQSTPRKRMGGTLAKVSTLLITVGLFHRPCCTGNGGLLRGSARLPSIASSNAVSSPQIYPPGLTNISRAKLNSLPSTFGPSRSDRTQRRISSWSIFSWSSYSWRIYRMPFCAPVSSPARIIPSITRCGKCVRMKRSLNVPGSLSSALHTIYFSGPGACRTSCHFDSVGNPAPPRPRRPEAFSVSKAAAQSRDAIRRCTVW